MKQTNINDINVNITTDENAFVVDIDKECYAETYMDRKPYRWPNPEDSNRLWSYIKGPAKVKIPVPTLEKHNFAVYIGGRIIPNPPFEHDFTPVTETNKEQEQVTTKNTVTINKESITKLVEELHKILETISALLN